MAFCRYAVAWIQPTHAQGDTAGDDDDAEEEASHPGQDGMQWTQASKTIWSMELTVAAGVGDRTGDGACVGFDVVGNGDG